MRPKKVLFVHHGGRVGGAPVSMLQLAAALDRDRFNPEVVFTEEGPILEYAKGLDVPARVFRMRSAFSYSASVPLRLRSLWPFIFHYRQTVAAARRLVQTAQPDMVHLNTSVLVPTAVGVKQTGIPILWHVREPAGPNPALRRWHVNRVKSLSDFIVANSQYVAREYTGTRPVAVIHNALDKRRFTPHGDGTRDRVRAELGLAKDSPVVGIIGSVQSNKGHYVLVDAASLVVKDVPDARFLVVAGGAGVEYARRVRGRVKSLLRLPLDNAERMRRYIHESKLSSHFVFSGFRSDIPEVISAMDVLVFPSVVPEGFGRPLVEAMAMGCPTVATDIGPTREVVGEGTAVLVRPGNVPELASALVAVLRDREMARRLGDAGRRRFLEHFEMEAMRAKLQDVYDQVLSNGRLS